MLAVSVSGEQQILRKPAAALKWNAVRVACTDLPHPVARPQRLATAVEYFVFEALIEHTDPFT